jgi:hypothetical protein
VAVVPRPKALMRINTIYSRLKSPDAVEVSARHAQEHRRSDFYWSCSKMYALDTTDYSYSVSTSVCCGTWSTFSVAADAELRRCPSTAARRISLYTSYPSMTSLASLNASARLFIQRIFALLRREAHDSR